MAGSRTPPPLFIAGESGTGKRMLAELLHRAGPRADGPFVCCAVAGIPDYFWAPELFGYVRGGLDGGNPLGRPGLFHASQRGTLLLSEMALLAGSTVRHELVAVIERGAVRRIGGTTLETVDVWVMADASSSPDTDIDGRRLRDVFDPVPSFTLALPPLRERDDDVLLLAEHFLAHHSAAYERPMTLSEDARRALRERDWPGNVRELSNAMERLVVISPTDRLEAEHVRSDWMPTESKPLFFWKTAPGRRRSRSRARRSSS